MSGVSAIASSRFDFIERNGTAPGWERRTVRRLLPSALPQPPSGSSARDSGDAPSTQFADSALSALASRTLDEGAGQRGWLFAADRQNIAALQGHEVQRAGWLCI
jgi:hypothetical protein